MSYNSDSDSDNDPRASYDKYRRRYLKIRDDPTAVTIENLRKEKNPERLIGYLARRNYKFGYTSDDMPITNDPNNELNFLIESIKKEGAYSSINYEIDELKYVYEYASKGPWQVLIRLMQEFPAFNERFNKYVTAAFQHNNLVLLKALFENVRKPDVGLLRMMLFSSIREKKYDIVKFLIDNGAVPDDYDFSLAQGDIKMLKLLTKDGILMPQAKTLRASIAAAYPETASVDIHAIAKEEAGKRRAHILKYLSNIANREAQSSSEVKNNSFPRAGAGGPKNSKGGRRKRGTRKRSTRCR